MTQPRGNLEPLDITAFEYEDPIGEIFTCRIRAFWTEPNHVVILSTEYTMDDREAMMHQVIDEIATDFRRVHGISDVPFTWIEHYDDRTSDLAMTIGHPDRPDGEQFFIVHFSRVSTPTHEETKLSEPQRTPITKTAVEHLIGISLP